MKLGKNLKESLKMHIVDSTALITATVPILAAFETYVAGMSNENSINSRLLVTGVSFAGMASLFSKGMDLSRKVMHIKPETKERVKQIHDAAYSTIYNVLISPPFYYAAGVRDVKQIAIGTATIAGLSLFMGGPVGYAVDSFRDLTGIKESERLPNFVQRQNKNVKRGLAALLIASSFAITSGVYESNKLRLEYQTQHQEDSTNRPEVRSATNKVNYQTLENHL